MHGVPTDWNGVPVFDAASAAHVHDGMRQIDLVNTIPPIRVRRW